MPSLVSGQGRCAAPVVVAVGVGVRVGVRVTVGVGVDVGVAVAVGVGVAALRCTTGRKPRCTPAACCTMRSAPPWRSCCVVSV
jgi:hypothetical protein